MASQRQGQSGRRRGRAENARSAGIIALVLLTLGSFFTFAVVGATPEAQGIETVIASDTFNRTVAGGWGTADVGGAWTVVDAPASWSVAQ